MRAPTVASIQTASRVCAQDGARATKMFLRDGRRVFVHPSSVNFSVSRFESGWLVYTELVETTKPFLRDTSMVPVYAMLFFGGAIDANAVRGTLTVDGWARFKAPGKVAVLVRELQAEVRRVLLQKIRNPGGDVSSNPALLALQRLVATDGQ